MLWLSHLDRVDPAGRAKVFIGIKVDQARRVNRLGGSPLYLSQPLLSLVDGSPRCVRKCMKSRLAKGSSGGRVTLLPDKLNSPYIKSLTLPVSDLSLLIIFPVSSSFSSSISLISLTSVVLVLETLLLKDHSESPGSSRKWEIILCVLKTAVSQQNKTVTWRINWMIFWCVRL